MWGVQNFSVFDLNFMIHTQRPPSFGISFHTVTWYEVMLDGVFDWILDLLTTYTHDSELQLQQHR
jgi:hypothetical protein